MVPTVLFPLGMPSTVQDTAVLAAPETVAVRARISPVLTSVTLGLTTKAMAGGGAGVVDEVVDVAAAEVELPPPPLQAIREQITPMARMPSRRT
jgi:hypothetical protein